MCPKLKSKILYNVKYFASRSTIHGVNYIFDKNISLYDRFLWTLICLSSAFLAIYLIKNSYTDWKSKPVVTTLQSVAKPITDLDFPAVTICGEGQHMGIVEKVLFHNFQK